MKTANRFGSVIVMAFAALVFFQAGKIPNLQVSAIGPDFFPKVLASILFLLGMIQFCQSWRTAHSETEFQSKIKHPLIAMGLMIAYLLLFNWFGFLISTPLIVFTFLYYLKIRKWQPLFLTPVGITLLIYAVFVEFLNVPLPMGSLLN